MAFANQATNQVSNQVKGILKAVLTEYASDIIQSLGGGALTRKELLENVGLSNQSKNKVRHIDPLIEMGWTNYTIPKNPKDRNQKYLLTEAGQRVLQLIT